MFFYNILKNPVILDFSTLSEVDVEVDTSGNSLGDVKKETLVHTLFNSLEEIIV